MERKRAPVAQLDRALASGARGRGFESRRVRHFFARFGQKNTKPQGFTSLREARLHSKGAAFSSHLHPKLLITGLRTVTDSSSLLSVIVCTQHILKKLFSYLQFGKQGIYYP